MTLINHIVCDKNSYIMKKFQSIEEVNEFDMEMDEFSLVKKSGQP